jgi:hypothetical protein
MIRISLAKGGKANPFYDAFCRYLNQGPFEADLLQASDLCKAATLDNCAAVSSSERSPFWSLSCIHCNDGMKLIAVDNNVQQ